MSCRSFLVFFGVPADFSFDRWYFYVFAYILVSDIPWALTTVLSIFDRGDSSLFMWFVNPNGVHAQNIERLWHQIPHFGTLDINYLYYLAEFTSNDNIIIQVVLISFMAHLYLS